MTVLARFVGIDLTSDREPNSTTLKSFRHLLEDNELASKILDQIIFLLTDKGLMLSEATIVDPTLIAAPLFDQEQGQNPRPRDAPGQEG